MGYVLRFFACLSLLGLLAAGVCALRPAALTELGLDLWEWPGAKFLLDSEEQRRQELDHSLQAIVRRRVERDRIGRELIAGHISLAEAVRQTSELCGEPDNFPEHLRVAYPACRAEERLDRYVIDWTCELLKSDAGQAAAVRARLEREMTVRHDP
jgi:hypothetical protein